MMRSAKIINRVSFLFSVIVSEASGAKKTDNKSKKSETTSGIKKKKTR